MKNSNDTIGNRTPDLPDCSAVPQPTAPPRAPLYSSQRALNFPGRYYGIIYHSDSVYTHEMQAILKTSDYRTSVVPFFVPILMKRACNAYLLVRKA